ncbi:MAG: hypothetical protein LBH93_06190, partial [Chitinispirillales bacterium]|nr:hypothetical protein [Chitinispirillales bacterium]
MNIKGVALRVGAALTIVAAVGLIGCNGDEPLATYTLMTTAEPRAGGSIIRSLNESYYEAGTKVTLTAVENTGYAFVGWDGAMSSRDKSITVTMNNNLTLTANFQREETGGGDTTVPKVTINGLTWMKKNLNIETPDSWCYNDSASYCAKYGRLYTWEAAKSACQSMGGG